jgi:hypothetical protein
MKGYISKAELKRFIETPIEKANGTPIILEVWKDEEDYRDCVKGIHLIEIDISHLQEQITLTM